MLTLKNNIVLVILLFSTCLYSATLSAFPGAEGFGSNTIHGRGGIVIEVTNLNDSGAGSLREAVNTEDPRIIVFRVGGIISLKDCLTISKPFCMIAGQTATGDGICLKNAPLSVITHDVVIRFLRSRPGDGLDGTEPDSRDAFQIYTKDEEVYNVIFDHCSASWGIDENLDSWGGCDSSSKEVHDVTYQWCISSESLNDSRFGIEGKGFLIGDKTHRISIHHCLFAQNQARSPLFKANTYSDFVNNVIYNWGPECTYFSNDEKTDLPIFTNIVCNYYKKIGGYEAVGFTTEMPVGSKIYLHGNICPTRLDDTQDQWAIADISEPILFKSNIPNDADTVTTWVAESAYVKVLKNVGATLPKRDTIDKRIISDVINGTGEIISSQEDVGGWPAYNSGVASVDNDHDGMPDNWEIANGLNPNNKSDAVGTELNSDGYTNIEVYLNGLVDTTTITGIISKNIPSVKRVVFWENFPNPFGKSINITFNIFTETSINLSIYNLHGELIKVLNPKNIGIKKYSAVWNGIDKNGKDVPNGTYLIKLSAENILQVKRIVLLR